MLCTPRERSLLRIPQNAEHIKWTTEGAVKGGIQSLPSILRRVASVNCRDMLVSGECAASRPQIKVVPRCSVYSVLRSRGSLRFKGGVFVLQERNIIMLKPTLEKAKELTGYSVIPVCREILSDFTTPIEVLKKLRRVSRHVYILESVENQEKWGRYTFLGYNPKLELTCTNGELTVKDVVTGKTETSHQAHPAAYIKELMKKYTSPKLEGFPSFTGGLVGYFSYGLHKVQRTHSEPRREGRGAVQDVDPHAVRQGNRLRQHTPEDRADNQHLLKRPRKRVRKGRKQTSPKWSSSSGTASRRYPARKAPLGVPQAVQRGAVTAQWSRRRSTTSTRATYSRWCSQTALTRTSMEACWTRTAF